MPLRIILADDHPVIVRGIQTILEEESEFQILAEFRNGHALLQSPLIGSADLLFLDLNMPKVDGKKCLSELKKSARLKDIPVVIYSTSSLKKDIEETKAMGAVHFMTKPSAFRELCDAIGNVLSYNFSASTANSETSN